MRTFLTALAALTLIPACGTTSSKVKHQQFDDEMAPRVGRDKREDIAAEYGIPSQKDKIDETEVWVYRFNEVGKVRRAPFGGINAYQNVDEVYLTFGPDGLLKTYRLVLKK
jgi:hypothetical protein